MFCGCAKHIKLTFNHKIVLRLCCDHYVQLPVVGIGRSGHVTSGTEKERKERSCRLHPATPTRMKHRSTSEQHHGKKPRVPAAAAATSTSPQDGMEDKAATNPRELTQNPLKKIWMPYKNGLPEKHICQRKGAYDMATTVSLNI